MEIYIALNSYPDTSLATFHSAHTTLKGAQQALFPERECTFRKWGYTDVWEGPDGYGIIRKVPLHSDSSIMAERSKENA